MGIALHEGIRTMSLLCPYQALCPHTCYLSLYLVSHLTTGGDSFKAFGRRPSDAKPNVPWLLVEWTLQQMWKERMPVGEGFYRPSVISDLSSWRTQTMRKLASLKCSSSQTSMASSLILFVTFLVFSPMRIYKGQSFLEFTHYDSRNKLFSCFKWGEKRLWGLHTVLQSRTEEKAGCGSVCLKLFNFWGPKWYEYQEGWSPGGRETFDGWPNEMKAHIREAEGKDSSSTAAAQLRPPTGRLPALTAVHTGTTMCPLQTFCVGKTSQPSWPSCRHKTC